MHTHPSRQPVPCHQPLGVAQKAKLFAAKSLKTSILFVLLLGVLAVASAQTATVTVNTGTTYQTFEGVSGNYPWAGAQVTDATESPTTADLALGTFNQNNAESGYARFFVPLRFFEPSNGTFSDTKGTHESFLQMQAMYNAGFQLIASVYTLPDWMTGGTASGTIPSSEYSAAATEIAQMLTTLHDTYGVTVKYVSFNEPNGNATGGAYPFTASSYATFIGSYGGPAVANLGYGTTWLAVDAGQDPFVVGGSDNYITDEVSWATTLLASASAYCGALSYHFYGIPTSSDQSTMSSIQSLAATYGLPVIVPEGGSEVGNDYSWLGTGGGQGAFGLAQTMYCDITYAHAAAVGFWECQNEGEWQTGVANADGSVTPNVKFYLLKQMKDTLPPGSVIVSSSSNNSTVEPIAATDGSNFTVVAINTNTTAASVTFNGIPNDTLKLVETNASLNESTVNTYGVSGNTLTVSIPAQTVATLTTLSIPGITVNSNFNALQDPTFASGSLNYWSTWVGTGSSSDAYIASGSGYGSDQNELVQENTTGSLWISNYQSISGFTPGASFTASAYAKTSASGSGGLTVQDGAGGTFLASVSVPAGVSSWSQYSCSGTVPADGTLALALGTGTLSANQYVAWDSASLIVSGGGGGTTEVDDTSGAITYNGTWTAASTTGCYDNTQHYSNTTNDNVQFTFTGTSIIWVGARWNNHGMTDVYIDSVYQGRVDAYSASNLLQQNLFEKTGLSNGSHTIKLVCTGV